ncbi:MAG: chemotaxis protein CheW [Rhodospirillaceae bacterium]|nr:chemotaxis protein CheW [Rhodospirillaceae bacterium]
MYSLNSLGKPDSYRFLRADYRLGLMATDISIFELDDARYGLKLADTREVFRMPQIAPLPKAPAVVEGIVNVRGRVVPVFSLRRRFGLPDKPPHPSEHLLLASAGARAVALRADRVIGAARVDPAAIDALQAITPAASFFAGVAKLEDGLVLIHDLATFLRDSEAAELDQALRDRDMEKQ